MLSDVDPRNHVLDEGTDPPWEGAILKGKSMPWNAWQHWRELCKKGRPDQDAIWVMDLGGPKEACTKLGPDPPCEGAIIRRKDMPRHARQHSAVSCASMAKSMYLPFGLWTHVSQRKHNFDCSCQVVTICPHGKAHWWHLANMIEPVQIPPWEGAILRDKGRPIVKYRDDLPWAAPKRLNWSRCRLGRGFGWAQGIMYYTGIQIAPCEGTIFRGKDMPRHAWQHCHELCKSGWTDRHTVWSVN